MSFRKQVEELYFSQSPKIMTSPGLCKHFYTMSQVNNEKNYFRKYYEDYLRNNNVNDDCYLGRIYEDSEERLNLICLLYHKNTYKIGGKK